MASPKMRSENFSGNWLPSILETRIKFRGLRKVFHCIYCMGRSVEVNARCNALSLN